MYNLYREIPLTSPQYVTMHAFIIEIQSVHLNVVPKECWRFQIDYESIDCLMN